MHDLTHEALETLLLCANVGEIKNYFGVRTMDLWNQHMEKTYQTVLRDKTCAKNKPVCPISFDAPQRQGHCRHPDSAGRTLKAVDTAPQPLERRRHTGIA